MRKRVILTTIVSFILLLAVVLAGLNAIFTVTSVRAAFCTYSADGRREAEELQEKLNGYIGKSLTFLDLKDLETEAGAYPYFRVEQAEKKYPDRVELSIVERQEALAYILEDGSYATLDIGGEFLRENLTLDNRVSGKNIPLAGFGFRLNNGRTEGRYFEPLIQSFAEFTKVLGEVRSNILSVELKLGGGASAPDTHSFLFAMQEGVRIEIYNPQDRAAEKAKEAAELYAGTGAYENIGLDDGEKVGGVITVNTVNGEIVCNYQPDLG